MLENHSTEAENQFESGMLALICYGGHVKYDNITVTGDSVTGLATASVESFGKLATVWGEVKQEK